MHIGSGFLSPPVWGTMAAVSGAALAVSLAAAPKRLDERRVPLMGVMGAFVFAAQMVNFPILAGTSGHLGGGFLLGILLGTPLGIIVMGSILVVQSLLFQDGGVEALGANIFAMGVMPCLLGGAVRWLWTRRKPGLLVHAVTFAGGIVSVLAGATAVAVLLWWSGSLPAQVTLPGAIGVMDFIHLWIGVVEGLVTAAVARFVLAVRRDAVLDAAPQTGAKREAA